MHTDVMRARDICVHVNSRIHVKKFLLSRVALLTVQVQETTMETCTAS